MFLSIRSIVFICAVLAASGSICVYAQAADSSSNASAGCGVNANIHASASTVKADAATWAAAQKIAASNACMGCHQVNRTVVGPSFRQIAAKYRNDPAAQTRLMQKIKHGGSGVWGVLPMPSHPQMSDADLSTVTRWILAGAPPAH